MRFSWAGVKSVIVEIQKSKGKDQENSCFYSHLCFLHLYFLFTVALSFCIFIFDF